MNFKSKTKLKHVCTQNGNLIFVVFNSLTYASCTSTWHSKEFLAPTLKIRNHTDETKEEIAMCFKLHGFFSYSNLRARYLNSVIASLGKRLTATSIWYQGINLTYLISWNSCVSTARSFRPLLFFRVAVQALHDHHQRFEMHVDQCSLNVLINVKVQNEAKGNCHAIKMTALNEFEQSTYYFFCIIVSTKLYIGKEQTEKQRQWSWGARSRVQMWKK